MQLYSFDVDMPEEGLYELTIIGKNDGSLNNFQDKTWGKVVHQAFMFMNRKVKEEEKSRTLK